MGTEFRFAGCTGQPNGARVPVSGGRSPRRPAGQPLAPSASGGLTCRETTLRDTYPGAQVARSVVSRVGVVKAGRGHRQQAPFSWQAGAVTSAADDETAAVTSAADDTAARDLAEVPAVEVVSTLAVHLMTAAAIRCGLGDGPDAESEIDLAEARILITALAGMITAAAPDLGSQHAAPLRDGLTTLQRAFREASVIPDPPGEGPGERLTGPVSMRPGAH